MDPVRYDTIVPNIGRVDVDGAAVKVTWTCPVSGREVAQSTAWMAADPSIGARVGASVKRSIAYEIIYGAARVVADLIGGVAGRVVSNAAYTAASDINQKATQSVDYTDASREAAIVSAFESVKGSFVWDDAKRRFVARPAPAQTPGA
jgi:hypothetical protein